MRLGTFTLAEAVTSTRRMPGIKRNKPPARTSRVCSTAAFGAQFAAHHVQCFLHRFRAIGSDIHEDSGSLRCAQDGMLDNVGT